MAKVSATHHLTRRNGVWYYRRRVPTTLVTALGKSFIQFSLDTTKLADAKKRRAAEDLKWDVQFEAMAAQQLIPTLGHQTPALKQIPPHEVARLVQEYVERADQRSSRQLAQDPPESQAQKTEIRQGVEYGHDMLLNRDDIRADERVFAAGQKILQQANATFDEQQLPYVEFAEMVRRGLVEIDRRKLARLDDDQDA